MTVASIINRHTPHLHGEGGGSLGTVAGVFMAHFGTDQGGAVFGTMSGSLSILSLVASLFLVKKLGSCCGCTVPTKK